ncbi:MAG TPA: hypothetical protein PK176_16345 [Acidobacteriota bacterium]|nr:hypothetical protein [Acidobacteriota bacterium]HQM64884.1 hypothetical protein [Acidobacteriota bacterium]
MERREIAGIALTVLAALAVGGLIGAGIGNGLYSPAAGVAVAAAIGIATGLLVRLQVRRSRRARPPRSEPSTRAPAGGSGATHRADQDPNVEPRG